MMKKLNCLVIDDEPLACKGLEEYIQEMEMLNFIASIHHPVEAVEYLTETDLLFLDINMPKISGLDFLQQLKNPPLTIITTAYPQYALKGYELDVVDYLLKPISFPRFLKATTKAVEYFKLQHTVKPDLNSTTGHEYFFVKSNGILEKILLSDVIAVQALSNYTIIHCSEKKVTAYLTLKQVNEYLSSPVFIQSHKSYVVNIDKIDKIDHDTIILGQLNIPIGLNFKSAVMERITNGKILKR
jgi:DNA-binding LytR/AlgR family response regulator